MANRIGLPNGRGELGLPETEDGYVSAVVCKRVDGTVGWRALPPKGVGDAWVAVRLTDHEVVAKSWSCWLVHFDIATGIETSRLFTK